MSEMIGSTLFKDDHYCEQCKKYCFIEDMVIVRGDLYCRGCATIDKHESDLLKDLFIKVTKERMAEMFKFTN